MMTLRLLIVIAAFALPLFLVTATRAEVWTFKDEFFPILIKQVPEILAKQNPENGQFGTDIWIVREQEAMFPLAVAWASERADNPYFHDAKLLDAIMLAGDALADDQDETGQWTFRKEDGSTWGQIFMPWTYSRWIQTYALIKDAMPSDRREKWKKALTLGFQGISKNELNHMHNIPAHQARGLYCAGLALERPEWCAQAKAFMKKVCEAQDPAGFWSENLGPVVGYGFVYTDSLGVYYAMSKDETVLPALERAAKYHASFTYPDGTTVETIDERMGYSDAIVMPNVGFSFTPVGRGYSQSQWNRKQAANSAFAADGAASHYLYGEEGEAIPPPGRQDEAMFVLGENDAMTRRAKPWFACLSAYHAPVPTNRWFLDRQNFLSIYHDEVGVILGGGNTKLQPLWSTFTVGDVSLLKHTPGEENPKFTPPPGILHVPSSATLDPDTTTLRLDYGDVNTHVRAQLLPDTGTLLYGIDSKTSERIEAHVPLLPRMGKAWTTASGKSGTLSDEAIKLNAGEAGAWIQLDRLRVTLPADAEINWPILPHAQYRKDGSAEPKEGRFVITLPLSNDAPTREITLQIVPES